MLKNVKAYKEININGNQAYLIKDKGGYTNRIETFFDNVNILLTCYVGSDVTEKEALSFMKGVNITEGTKKNHTEYVSPDDGTKADIEYFPKESKYLPLPIGKEITYGDDLDLSFSYRIDSIKVMDKPFGTDKSKYYFEGDDFENHIDSSFNLIPQKNEKWEYGDGVNTVDKLISSKTEKMKFVVAKITYSNHSNEPTFGLNFGIEYLDKNKNGEIENREETITLVQYNKDIKSCEGFYIGKLKKGESHTYTLGFTVYESQLDKACFEHKCIELGIADDEVEIVDHRDELIGFGVMCFDSVEVGSHAVFEELCLTDIDDLSGLIFHLIHTRMHRQLV